MLRKHLRATGLNAAFLQEIKQDHRELQNQLAELRSWLGCETEESTPPPGMTDAASALAQFEQQVRRRFELEEAFGYFREALIDQPWLGDRADALRGQHPVLAEQLAQIVHQAQQGSAEGAAALRPQLRDFLALYDRHEKEENDLIMAVFNDEVGVGD